MGVEIERKWLIKEMPTDLERYPVWEIEQGYLNFSPAIRVRHNRASEFEIYELTYKSKGLRAHQEENMPLDRESYERLLKKCEGVIVQKKRYRIPIGKYVGELDVFEGALAGIVLIEVEFPSVEEEDAFTAPSWFGEDVTNSGKYSNAYLARTRFQ